MDLGDCLAGIGIYLISAQLINYWTARSEMKRQHELAKLFQQQSQAHQSIRAALMKDITKANWN